MTNRKKYFFLDSGDGYRLEDFGGYLFKRPCGQALWNPQQPDEWNRFDAFFTRDKDKGWDFKKKIPPSWVMEVENILFTIQPTDFGHMGVFPEHATLWRFLSEQIISSGRKDIRVLNLFAYSGGATLSAAKAGAKSVTHLDASKPMVALARDNAALNRLDTAPIRWIVDDVMKFLKREIKRNVFYDVIILDPPSFGRGTSNEVFKIEEDIIPLLSLCKQLLSDNPLSLIFSCHTPSFTPMVMSHLLKQQMGTNYGQTQSGEMLLNPKEDSSFPLPLGSFAIWTK